MITVNTEKKEEVEEYGLVVIYMDTTYNSPWLVLDKGVPDPRTPLYRKSTVGRESQRSRVLVTERVLALRRVWIS